MVLAVVLAIVGGVSFIAARMVQQGIGHRRLIGNAAGHSLRSQWTPRTAALTVLLTGAIFVPLLLVTYYALALVEHLLGH